MSNIKRLVKKGSAKTASLFDAKQRRLNRTQNKIYEANDAQLQSLKAGSHRTAVVVHLYYTDSWDLISASLKNLPPQSFDLFVSLPTAAMNFSEHIRADYPRAYIYETPNRGRDVLPFLYIARYLSLAGYQSVLKLHSKKSTHRTDGIEWLSDMLQALLPAQASIQTRLREVLDSSDTGVIGPAGQYLKLNVNFEANGTHMTRILNKIYSKQIGYDILQKNRDMYGFFAGTMFWARLDALSPIINAGFGLSNFETEKGQIDATFAHALERVFCLVTEIENRKLYEIGPDRIKEILYSSGNIPDWSNVYIGPRAKRDF